MSDQTTVDVVLSSESTVGNPIIETVTVIGTVPIGPRGIDGVGGGGGAPDDATYLVATAHADLDNEIPVGATPGGELGGTWAAPTVDANHAGSTHAAVQAAAEATAAAALATHAAGDVRDGDPAGGVLSGTYPNPGFAVDMATQAELDAEAALARNADNLTSGTVADARIASTIARDSEVTAAVAAHEADTTAVHGIADTSALETTTGAQAKVDAHVNDTSDAHDASAISIADAGNDFTATDVEGALAELQADHEADATALSDHIADASAAHAASAVSYNGSSGLSATDVEAALDELDTEKAPLASPTFTGTPAAPTASQGTNTTQLATTAYVQTEAGLLVPKSLVDAKGDLIVATGADTVARLAVGANGSIPTADSAESTGLKYITRATLAADAAFTAAYLPLAAIACRLNKSSDQTVNAGATAACSFDGEAFDPSGLHDNSTNNTRITNTTGATRKFMFGGAVQFGTNAVPGQVYLRLNGTDAIPGGYRGDTNDGGMVLPPTIVELANNGYAELMFLNAHGSNSTTLRGSATPIQVHCSFWAYCIGT